MFWILSSGTGKFFVLGFVTFWWKLSLMQKHLHPDQKSKIVMLPDCIGWKSIHINLHVSPNLRIGQTTAGWASSMIIDHWSNVDFTILAFKILWCRPSCLREIAQIWLGRSIVPQSRRPPARFVTSPSPSSPPVPSSSSPPSSITITSSPQTKIHHHLPESRKTGRIVCPLFAWSLASGGSHSCHCTRTYPGAIVPWCHRGDLITNIAKGRTEPRQWVLWLIQQLESKAETSINFEISVKLQLGLVWQRARNT